MPTLKSVSADAVPAALARAEQYRLLNEPADAESICRDVLLVDPDNQQAIRIALLAVTDQFAGDLVGAVPRAMTLLARLGPEYEHAYYAGLIAERRAKALIGGDGVTSEYDACVALRNAMEWYELADERHPQGNDEARLRWNTCARILNRLQQPVARAEERIQIDGCARPV